MKKVNNKMTYILNDIISKSNNISLAENIPHLLDDQLKSSKKLSKNYLKYFTKNTNRLVVLRKLNNVKFIDDSYAINNYAFADPGDNILFAPNKSNIISKTYSNKFKKIVNEL